MTPKLLNIQGPPGTGKTARMTRGFIRAVELAGAPERVAAVTYTRSAAQELQNRAAAALKLHGDPSKELPWVGTIHSLCYKLLGRPKMVDGKRMREFAKSQGLQLSNESIVESPEYLSAPRLQPLDLREARWELDAALSVLAASRHRMIPPEAALNILPPHSRRWDEQRLLTNIEAYKKWKQGEKLLDYEDLLEAGKYLELPVTSLFVDECQDNSLLLWDVIDAWGSHTQMVVCAGDIWQSLYVYSGAVPQVFADRPGEWQTLQYSHRLEEDAVRYAQGILLQAGWNDPRITAWQGIPHPQLKYDDSVLCLARTNNLVRRIEADLIKDGEPYHLIRGAAPLQKKFVQQYLVCDNLMDGQLLPVGVIYDAIVEYLPLADMRSKLREEALIDPDHPISRTVLEALIHISLAEVQRQIPFSDYYWRVREQYGKAALIAKPKTRVGTIHASKGQEADYVKILNNWGSLPGRRIADEQGGLEEACVAYVAASRHRKKLEIINDEYGDSRGTPYPFA